MTAALWLIYVFIVLQRLAELAVARRNEKWMKARGAFEAGKEHYKWFVIVHALFFVAILSEAILRPDAGDQLNIWLFILFILTQFIRLWCLLSLGRFWNTKIIILPGAKLVDRGPYRYIKHPNYLIVGIELVVIPLLFQAYISALVFPILHLLLLRIRIPEEEKALARLQNDKDQLDK